MRKAVRVIFALVLLSLVCSLGIDAGGGDLARARTSETFVSPPEIVSSNGVLNATLTAGTAMVKIGTKDVLARVYDGLYVPPTLRVRPGDTIKLRLVNTLGTPTSLHYHGLEVSPRGRSDNVFVHLGTSEVFDYKITIPRNHGAGLFWYHSHQHGLSESQVGGGMSGGLIVDGILDPFPELKGIRERVMLLKDAEIDGSTIGQKNDPARSTRTLNGLINPTVKIRPGETQFWRIGNIGANAYYRLQLEGHTLYKIAQDGNRLNQIVGSQALAFNTGPEDQNPEVILATIIAEGPTQQPLPLPAKLPPVADLRKQPVAHKREIVFSEGPGKFFINGKQFDMDRVDTTVNLGDVEGWTIRNASDEMHTFHIHQLDFQVVEVDGRQVPFIGVQDNVNVPVGGVVKILVSFTDPVIVGKFVYHCHILSHEDKGMMAVIEVKPPR